MVRKIHVLNSVSFLFFPVILSVHAMAISFISKHDILFFLAWLFRKHHSSFFSKILDAIKIEPLRKRSLINGQPLVSDLFHTDMHIIKK